MCVFGLCSGRNIQFARIYEDAVKDVGASQFGHILADDANLLQTGTTIHRLTTDECQAGRQHYLRQSTTTSQSIVAQGYCTLGDVQFATLGWQHGNNLCFLNIPYNIIFHDEIGISSKLTNLQYLKLGTQTNSTLTPLFQASWQYQFLQTLAVIEGLEGQFVISRSQLFAVIYEISLTSTHEASLREVKGIQKTFGLLAILVDTSQTTYLTQVGRVDVTSDLQRTHRTNLLVIQYCTQGSCLGKCNNLVSEFTWSAFDADNHILLHIKVIPAWIQQGYIVVAIIIATPAPVNIHFTIFIIAMNYESMTTARPAGTTVIKRSVLAQLAINNIHPIGLSVVITLQTLCFCNAKIGT